MNVADVLDVLQSMDPKMEVQFAYNYGAGESYVGARDIESIMVTEVVYSEHAKTMVIPDEWSKGEIKKVVLFVPKDLYRSYRNRHLGIVSTKET